MENISIQSDLFFSAYKAGWDSYAIKHETIVSKKWYAGKAFEWDSVTDTKYHYVYFYGEPVALFIQQGEGEFTHYVILTDHLGSIDMITDIHGNIVDSMSFDAWGNRRDRVNWEQPDTDVHLTDRGFTMHQHLDAFKLINMGGRVYDPVVQQFLSPDPYVQDPDNTQNLNRYAYCMNSPLMYTDPGGEIAITTYLDWMNVEISNFYQNTIKYDWVEDPNNPNKGVYFDPTVNSESEAVAKGLTYRGKTVLAENSAGKIQYGDQYGNWHDMVPLRELVINAQQTDHARAMYAKNKLGIGRVNLTIRTPSMPWDMIGVQGSFNLFVGGGFAVDVSLGYVIGDRLFLNGSIRAGSGYDISAAAGIITGNYHGSRAPSSDQLKGLGGYTSLGVMGWYYSISADIINKEIGTMWTVNSIGYSFGSKTLIGGSFGIFYTSPNILNLK